MRIRTIITLGIFAVSIPALFSIFIWIFKFEKNPTDISILKGGIELLAESVIPWWLGIFQFFAGLGFIGAILLIVFIIFLKWNGDIR